MPIHDWTRVSAGVFHAFHNAWITEIQNALNNGVLPPQYYALGEPVADPLGPDVVVTLPAFVPPNVRFTARAEMNEYLLKQQALVVRHGRDDRIIALVQIVSPGNKATRHNLRTFVEKAVETLSRGYHLLILDLHPPGPHDPQGIHGAIWAEMSDDSFVSPPDKPLTLVAYSAGQMKEAYLEPIAVGDVLSDMPLFLQPDAYTAMPLEATYLAAYRGVPQRWKRVLEAPPAASG